MTQQTKDARLQKISPAFAARLATLGAQQKIRAIVLLREKKTNGTIGTRPARAERKALIEARRKSAESSLCDIDNILAHVGGQRLSKTPNALGSVHVETTAAGINALAASQHVKAILEDQSVSLIR